MSAALANGLSGIFDFLMTILQVLVFASVLISWLGADPSNQIVQMIRQTTEPLYKPFRRLTDKIPGPFDMAPLALLLVIVFLQKSVGFYLRQLARSEGF